VPWHRITGDGHSDKLGQIARAHLVHDVRTMDFDGPGADTQIEGDYLVLKPVDNPVENLMFAFRQQT
jgi:hypothetical protein